MKLTPDRWYKREPHAFLRGVQGMGPELIGAYAVILEIIYARGGNIPRDDRHLSGVLGCSIRKARALTDQLLITGKLRISDGFLSNERASAELETRQKQRETSVKHSRNEHENDPGCSENKELARQKRREENNTPLSPQGGRGRKAGVPAGVLKLLEGGK